MSLGKSVQTKDLNLQIPKGKQKLQILVVSCLLVSPHGCPRGVPSGHLTPQPFLLPPKQSPSPDHYSTFISSGYPLLSIPPTLLNISFLDTIISCGNLSNNFLLNFPYLSFSCSNIVSTFQTVSSYFQISDP